MSKTIKIEVCLGIGIHNARQEDVLEVEVYDCDTQEDIDAACEEAFQQWMWNYIDGTWNIIEE